MVLAPNALHHMLLDKRDTCCAAYEHLASVRPLMCRVKLTWQACSPLHEQTELPESTRYLTTCAVMGFIQGVWMQGKVLQALWAVHWPSLATAAGCRMLQNLCAWSGPFLLQQLLSHLQAGAAVCKHAGSLPLSTV